MTHTELAIEGMTCASCVARVEKGLKKLDGVDATVNFATESAHVTHPADIEPEQLIEQVEATGYSAHIPSSGGHGDHEEQGHHAEEPMEALRSRSIVSALLSIPVIALAMIPALQFDNWQWLSLMLTAPVVTWGGWLFHKAAWVNLRHGAATMDTLISMGTLAAFGWSLYALFFGHAGEPGMRHTFSFTIERADSASQIYLEVAAGVTTFILIGRYFESRAKRNGGAALRALLEFGAKDVTVLRENAGQVREEKIPVDQLAVGDRFVIRPGEKVATDGIIEEGYSAVDASMMTGEPVPVDVDAGDTVLGGYVNANGRLIVRATRVGGDTQLAHMAALVADAQSRKAAVQRLADRISAVFVPIVIVVALATLAVWMSLGMGAAAAFTAAVAVLIIACPCALGLATPIALLVGTGRGAQLGIVIKGPEVLESTRTVDTVVLDKTGTVTTGAMTLAGVHTREGVSTDEALRLAGAVEQGSEHPIAAAITTGARASLGDLPTVDTFQSHKGLGVEGNVAGHDVRVGKLAFFERDNQEIPAELTTIVRDEQGRGRTVVVIGWDGEVQAIAVVSDMVKPTSRRAIDQLRGLGLTPILLTGDNSLAAHSVASEVGIDHENVFADVLPTDKVAVVRRLQDEGRTVAMVGDGVNDAAALAQADLGIAMGTGTDVAIEASDLTLVRDDVRAVPDAIALSRRTLGVIKGNLFWAFAYNVAGIPLAALGLLNPMLAGAAMALSSLFVVTNSLRLRHWTFR